MALLATTEDKLQQLVNDVGKASERFGLSLNAKKTQVMVIGRHTSSINIMYNGAPLEQVKQFIYLGASFNEKGDTIKEVKRRVAIRVVTIRYPHDTIRIAIRYVSRYLVKIAK